MTEQNSTASETTTAATSDTAAPAAAEVEAAPAAPAESAPAAEQAQTGAQESAGTGGEGGLLDDSSDEPEGKATDSGLPDTLGAPKEDYDYKGIDTGGLELGGETLEAFNAAAKELNLSQKAASTIVSKVAPAMQKAQETALRNARVMWIKDTKNDASIGWSQHSGEINRAYRDFTTPKLRELFSKTGLDSHPEVVRLFKSIADKISPDSFERGAAGARQSMSARQFYNKSNMND